MFSMKISKESFSPSKSFTPEPESTSFAPKKKETFGFADEPVKDEQLDLGTFVKEMISIINKRFDSLEKDIDEVKTDISSLKTDVSASSAQDTTISNLRSDISDLKSDIRDIRSDITSLKSGPSITMDKKALKKLKK